MAYDMTNDEIVEAASRLTPQWLAGFFDGEGSISSYKSGNGYLSFQVNITQAEPKILALIAIKFGMRVSVREVRGHRAFVAKFDGQTAIPFLKCIKDHVVCKRRQVEAAIGFASAATHSAERIRFAEVIKQANNGIETSLIKEVE